VTGAGYAAAIAPMPGGADRTIAFGMFGPLFGNQGSGAEGPALKRVKKVVQAGRPAGHDAEGAQGIRWSAW